jgi:hypothetical protein
MPSTRRQTRSQTRNINELTTEQIISVIQNTHPSPQCLSRAMDFLQNPERMMNDAFIIEAFKTLVTQGFMRALHYRVEDEFSVEDCLTEQNSAGFVDVVESYFNDYLNNEYVDMPNIITRFLQISEVKRGVLSLIIRQAFLQMVGYPRAQGRRVLYLADEWYDIGECSGMLVEFRSQMNQRYL